MTTKYQEQYAHDLKLELFKGELDESKFTVMKAEIMGLDEVKIIARIIGGSHYISFIGKDFLFHEVLACTNVENHTSRLHSLPIKALIDEFPESLRLDLDGHKYFFNAQIMDINILSKERFSNLFKNRSRRVMQHVFEGKEFLGLRPTTTIFFSVRDEGFFQETVHVYPNERKIVFSSSAFVA